ncbi:hypothetical protein MAPG_03611 [Magnaporthiopsis poae ATCC 64411]|uniref:Ubiquinone biosynthesis protein n=1 Tax=Magnaporthiopsis poae (strain ATCC 64411 / 73-15) TaxID=644358 RepID=A0A0C4DUH2_MAGP6|nr:hypothetical protein MAPG_03611 [Magnaporthiopsis poae ATCC 64411]
MSVSQPLSGVLRSLSRIPRASAARPALRKAGSRCLSSRTTASPPTRPLLRTPPSATCTPARHYYHPTTIPPDRPSPFSATETAILTAACAHVPTHGKTPPAETARITRLLAERARELFLPEDGNRALAQAEVNARAERLAWERLLLNEPVIGRWQEAQAIMAQPTFAPECLAELARLADDVWALAGDAAVDPSWYAKRAALSAVYAAAELYMTTDRSPGFRETREFVRRRFAETAEVGRAVSSVGQWLGFTTVSALNVLRSKGVNI